MIVSDLIELLQNCDPNAVVILSSDSEGNSYSPLVDCAAGFYNEKNQEFNSEEDVYEIELDDGETDVISRGIEAVVLWPEW